MDLGLKDKVAVVAAASRGLGRAVAEALAGEGARVAICARNPARLEATAAEIRQRTGADVLAQPADVTRPDQVHHFVAQARARWGSIHICVVNAGGPPAKEFSAITLDDWQHAIALNLMSAVYFAREVLPQMRQQKWGRLIFMTSVAVKQPIDGLLLSNAVRSAVIGLAKTLANECARDNVLVNTVCPGYTLTERLEELVAAQAAQKNIPTEEIYNTWKAQIPLGRLAQPHEFGTVVAFLASEKASYITGTSVVIDGGWVRSLLA